MCTLESQLVNQQYERQQLATQVEKIASELRIERELRKALEVRLTGMEQQLTAIIPPGNDRHFAVSASDKPCSEADNQL